MQDASAMKPVWATLRLDNKVQWPTRPFRTVQAIMDSEPDSVPAEGGGGMAAEVNNIVAACLGKNRAIEIQNNAYEMC